MQRAELNHLQFFPQNAEASYVAAIVDSSNDAIIGKDLNGIIKSWNPAAELIFGYPAAEVLGNHISLLFPPERLGEEAMILAKIRNGERVHHYDTVRRRKDGALIQVSVAVSPICDAQGAVVGASKILRDITQRHAADRSLREAKRALEEMLAERTVALAQRDLLLREVHHRVKNNLQIVDGLVMLQAYALRDPAARQALFGLHHRIYALGLVHQQLMGAADLKTFDAAPFLRELSTSLLERSAPNNVTLSVDADPLCVGMDFAVTLGLLVTELLTDALKHAFPPGGGIVSVSLHADGAKELILIVSDNGEGPVGGASREHALPGRRRGIICGLVDQLQAKLVVHEGIGRTTEIHVPMELS
jgi:PAS domain S-box-containing protein